MGTIETGELIATYKDDEATRQAVFDRVLAYFKEYESFHGECIMQSDDPQIYAPDVMADLADDILCFTVKYKGDE